MIREIKFRAWSPRRAKMFTGHSVDVFMVNGQGSDLNRLLRALQRGDMHGGEEYILQQYTGLKDKNGVEIYDGDILKEYALTRGRAVRKTKVYWMLKGRWNISSGTYEVIGNIYENGDLLK